MLKKLGTGWFKFIDFRWKRGDWAQLLKTEQVFCGNVLDASQNYSTTSVSASDYEAITKMIEDGDTADCKK